MVLVWPITTNLPIFPPPMFPTIKRELLCTNVLQQFKRLRATVTLCDCPLFGIIQNCGLGHHVHKGFAASLVAALLHTHELTELSFTLYTAPNAPLPSCCLLSLTSLAHTLFNEVISSNIYIHNYTL